MTEPLQTVSPDQLGERTAPSDDLFSVVFSPGGPLQKLSFRKLVAKLISTDLCKTSKALLDADLAYAADKVALVFNDPSPLLNGWYRKTGASGAGAWTQFETLSVATKAAAEAAAAAANLSQVRSFNAVPFGTRADLLAATSMSAGDPATVRVSDTATHAAAAGEFALGGGAAVVGAQIPNAGRYRYDGAAWLRIGDLDSQIFAGMFVTIPGGPRIVATDESDNPLFEITQALFDHPDINAMRPLALGSATAGQSMKALPGGARVVITDEADNLMSEFDLIRLNHPDTNAMRAAIATPSAGTLRRLRALAAAAAVSNPWDNPVMASPPTMTADATIDSSLTRQFRPASGGVLANNDFGLFGGVPVVTGGLPTMTYLSAVTRGIGTTPSGGNINGSGKTQYGQRVRFQHFGTKFDFLTYGTAKWRLIVNGQYASRSFLTSSAGSTANPSYNHVVFPTIGIRNIEIELDGGTPFGGVNCEPTGYIEQPGFDDALRMIIVGDSFGVGQLSSAFHNSWTQILARKLGIADVIANCLGGTGLINAGSVWNAAAHISDITAASPDIIGLAMGFNDQASSTAAIQAAATSWIASVRALNSGQFANTPIFVFGPWSGSTGPSATMIGVENAIAAAVTAARSAGDSSIWFLPNCTALTRPPIYGTGWVGGENGTGSSDLLTSNTDSTKTHPNDLGHEVLASYFNNVIRSVVLRSNSI